MLCESKLSNQGCKKRQLGDTYILEVQGGSLTMF